VGCYKFHSQNRPWPTSQFK